VGRKAAVACARRGLLFKRNAYNFVSLAHGETEIDHALAVLREVLQELDR
jgi:glutamate-1-semialdehyde aminotransferase